MYLLKIGYDNSSKRAAGCTWGAGTLWTAAPPICSSLAVLCSSLVPIGPHRANRGKAMPKHVHPIKGTAARAPIIAVGSVTSHTYSVAHAIWQSECSAVLHCLYIHPLHLQLVCQKPCLSECWAIAWRGALGAWWLTGAALLTQAQLGDFKKNKFYAAQVPRKVDLMKWNSANNTDILVQVKLAYELSFVKFPLASFDNGRELYLEEKKKFRSRYN